MTGVYRRTSGGCVYQLAMEALRSTQNKARGEAAGDDGIMFNWIALLGAMAALITWNPSSAVAQGWDGRGGVTVTVTGFPNPCCEERGFFPRQDFCCEERRFFPRQVFCCEESRVFQREDFCCEERRPFPRQVLCCGERRFFPREDFCCEDRRFFPRQVFCCEERRFFPREDFCCEDRRFFPGRFGRNWDE